jgi:predicted ATPase
MGAEELSDGTLRYLLLVAALHPELLEPLANLIHTAAESAQIIVVTHAKALVEYLGVTDGARVLTQLIELVKEGGETKAREQRSIDRPAWKCPLDNATLPAVGGRVPCESQPPLFLREHSM